MIACERPIVAPNGLPCVEWKNGRWTPCEYHPRMHVLPVAFDHLKDVPILANVGGRA